jgi:hypothetical protein
VTAQSAEHGPEGKRCHGNGIERENPSRVTHARVGRKKLFYFEKLEITHIRSERILIRAERILETEH